jgi:hypothetical protein
MEPEKSGGMPTFPTSRLPISKPQSKRRHWEPLLRHFFPETEPQEKLLRRIKRKAIGISHCAAASRNLIAGCVPICFRVLLQSHPQIMGFLGFCARRHYNGRVPAYSKPSPLDGLSRREEFPQFTDNIGATMQPESGIIDCAFENS